MPELKRSLLDEWYDALNMYKWKHALLNEPYFRNLDDIKKEISEFFPKEDLMYSARNHDNWLAYVLSDKQPNSIYLLNETAELLRFYRTIPNNQVYQLKRKDGKINYKGLQEKLFEVKINYLLCTVGLKPEIGHTYLLDSQVKEIDILLNFENKQFNVEATKYYDDLKEEILSLGMEIIWKIQHTIVKRSLTLDEIFSGYIAFKQKNASIIKSNKKLFHDGLKSFIHGYRSTPNNTIIHPAIKETDQYVFYIEPAFANNYETTYDTILRPFPAYIKFRIKANLKTNRYEVNVSAQMKDSVADANKRLLKKIEEKLKQHKHYGENLIIVIGIEQVYSSFNKNRALPIAQKDIDASAIHNVIRNKASVLLLFKTLNINGISDQKMILGHGIENENLYKTLQRIYLPVRYIPVNAC